ncbi:MAG TPA: hypothetical protein VFQ75_11305 [Candidatus Limnocylindrales bacterium]|nr:hypothetical protein [Candidatus Limnocylindrales bacterium]
MLAAGPRVPGPSARWRAAAVRRAPGALVALAVALGLPAIAAAHGLSPVYQSPLPLAVYLVGAAMTVALSFVFVLARDVRATVIDDGHVVHVPGALRIVLRIIGLVGWTWIVAQAIAGGASDAAVATLFLWVYGWVGVAMLSALLFPVWEWIDPFATIHDILAWLLRTIGVRGWPVSELPASVRTWPAAFGLAFFVWLELVPAISGATLTVVLVGYTVLTLALMAQFGRDEWRAQGETFTVWFRTLNRMAPFGVVSAARAMGEQPDADEDGVLPGGIDVAPAHVERRSFASGLLRGRWSPAVVSLIAIGVASIIFDGFSQTVVFASIFGAPGLVPKTLLLVAWLAIVVGAALWVGRTVSIGAIGAGLLPIAIGYLVAHYLTYLLIDGQRIVIAISDPLQQGSDLFGTAFFQPVSSILPAGLVWTLQLAAVVGGHMVGAWAGHVTAQRDMEALANSRPPRDMRHRKLPWTPAPNRNVRMREIPLAIVMVALTTITLWSLGQAIVVETPAAAVTTLQAFVSSR